MYNLVKLFNVLTIIHSNNKFAITMSCKVKYCRFSAFHTTKSHQCGGCGHFGHGQMECGNMV